MSAGPDPAGAPAPQAAEVVRRCAAQGLTLAVAESLTGGLLVSALVAVPGASTVVRGGVVAYATDLKATLLGVDAGLLERAGAVDPEVARAMAHGAAARLGADLGVATTGVAGPDPQDGHPPGTVHLGWATAAGSGSRTLDLAGVDGRQAVREATVAAALALLLELVDPA
ncbi:MAG: nicotinamide-nucleotide amidohydrolase family protein [Frankiales bacterium]|nr:nicotinamide-nucleotide amidohydrolase family protein [Frankiales bacterium]